MSIEDLESDSGSEDSFGSDTGETVMLIGKSEPFNQNNAEISNGSTVNRDHKLSSKGYSTHEPNDRKYSISHKSETDEPKPKKKNHVLENIFLHLYTCFEVKIQKTTGRKSLSNFLDICKIDT